MKISELEKMSVRAILKKLDLSNKFRNSFTEFAGRLPEQFWGQGYVSHQYNAGIFMGQMAQTAAVAEQQHSAHSAMQSLVNQGISTGNLGKKGQE